jgi:hypothetical protein
MAVERYETYYDLLCHARIRGRLLYDVQVPPQHLLDMLEAVVSMGFGENAVDIGGCYEFAEPCSCWLYNDAYTWGYLGGGHYVFDEEEDAVRMRLMCS